jgi:SMC interacting uncharacterized protein involved in chromosome segregation
MSERRTLGESTAHNRQSVRYSQAPYDRQSCGGKRLPVRSGKDPRDLHNKAMQKETKQKVIAFLAEHRYPAEISLKTLMNQKEFFSVVWFMISVILPEACPPESEQSVDALLRHLRMMEYPYVPPKSALQSCSSPLYHSTMLGLLHWLLELAHMNTAARKLKGNMSVRSVPDLHYCELEVLFS